MRNRCYTFSSDFYVQNTITTELIPNPLAIQSTFLGKAKLVDEVQSHTKVFRVPVRISL